MQIQLGLKWALDPSAQAPGASSEPPALMISSACDPLVPAPEEIARRVGRPDAVPLYLEQCASSNDLPNATQGILPPIPDIDCHVIPYVDPESADSLSGEKGYAPTARLIVPLIVKFCEQWLAGPARAKVE